MAAPSHPDDRLTGGRKLLAGIGVCLIVPLSAAFGVTVPLPEIVERVAGSLVSGSQDVAFEAARGRTGSARGVAIVLTAEELAAAVSRDGEAEAAARSAGIGEGPGRAQYAPVVTGASGAGGGPGRGGGEGGGKR